MIPILHQTTGALALALAGAAGICFLRDRLPGRIMVAGLVVLEAALLVVAVAGVIQLVVTDRDVDHLSLIGYLLTVLVLVPAASFWAFTEQSRHAVAVIIIACLAVPVMLLRTQQIWNAGVAG